MYIYKVQIVNRGTHFMINFPSILVPLVGLVFPAIAMASLFLHIQKNKIF
nr:photosystem I subunit VIII [Campylotropis brevifolia]USC52486.1 photosystem I subunit VIII [Campylotropis brevifolia]